MMYVFRVSLVHTGLSVSFCSLQPCGHLLGKGWPLGSLLCDVFMCLCHFLIRYPGSGVVLDCIDSRYLPSSLLSNISNQHLPNNKAKYQKW